MDSVALAGTLGAVAAIALTPERSVTLRALACAALLTVYWHHKMLWNLWRYRHFPGPMPLPLVGNISKKTKALHEQYVVWERKYGKTFKWFMGNNVVLVFNDVESVREIGLRHFSAFTNRALPPTGLLQFFHPTIQNSQRYGILRAKDTYWKGIRSIAHGILHSAEQLSSFAPLMMEAAQELSERLGKVKEGESVDIWRALGDMTLDVVGSTVFGVRFKSVKEEGADVVKAARIIFKNSSPFSFNNPYLLLALVTPSFIHPVLQFFAERYPTQAMREQFWAAEHLGKVSDQVFDLAQSGQIGSPDDPYHYNGNSFLKLFIEGHNRETNKNLSKDEVVAQAFTFLLAGYETTANTLAYAIYLLTQNKEAEEKLVEEIDRLGKGKPGLPSIEELKDYTYLQAVVKEVLRVFGPATLTTRESSKDLTIHGLSVYKSTTVHLTMNSLHWNEKYFPEPQRFLPERFVEGSEIYEKQVHRAHLPFGLGPRMCVASNFALTEAKLALITLYKKYRFDYDTKHEFKTAMGVTLSPVNGVRVFVRKRLA